MEVNLFYTACLILLSGINGMELGDNLLVNNRFLQPLVTINQQLFPNSIPGWNCTNSCEIINCTLISLNCTGQALDLSSTFIQQVSQIFTTNAGEHYLQFQYLLAKRDSNLKTFLAFINGIEVYRVSPLVNTDTIRYFYNSTVNLTEGTNNITFTEAGLNDTRGFRLASVSLQPIINTSQPQPQPQPLPQSKSQSLSQWSYFFEQFLDSEIPASIISFPASRILLGELVNVFISFDRLQLYYYHNRNYSINIEAFLKSISTLMNTKGSLSLLLQKNILSNIAQQQKEFISQLDYKYQYINAQSLNKSPNGFGFITNNDDLVAYSIPYFVLITAFLYILFSITYKFKISKVFRKYSFYGSIFLLMVCEGNIEQFSFYVCGEFSTFFSANLQHKIVNFCILLFFFFVIFGSFAFYLWFWSIRRSQASYFVDNVELKFSSFLCYTIDRGAICFIFGALHQLLLSSPNFQLLALSICEIGWIITQIISINYGIYKCSMLVWLNILQGFFRIGLQFSSYLYAQSNDPSENTSGISNLVHSKQILLFVIVWIVQFALCLFIFFKEFIYFFQQKSSSLRNLKQIQSKGTNKKRRIIQKNRSKKTEKQAINFYIILKGGKIKKIYSKKQTF